MRGHSRNDGIEHLSDSTAHRDGRIPCPDKATPGPSNELGRKSRRQNGAKSLSRFVFAQGFWQWNAEFTDRATTGYRFSPLFGLLRASRNFATLHARSLKARGSKCDSGNFPWKTKFSRSLGFKSPPLRQIFVFNGLDSFLKLFLRNLEVQKAAVFNCERFLWERSLAISLVSSPGAGKTAFLEKTLTMLHSRYRVAALVGDLATENDAVRLARSHAPVKQIITGTICHLEAAMVQNALEGWDINELDFLFIENVGNLVCPSSYDLGEDLPFVLLSVTEGEDKPLKYPTIFNSADVAVITKWDLAAAVEFDEEAAKRNIQAVRPGMDVLIASAKTGGGMAECVKFLELARSCSQFVEQGRSHHS